MFSFRDEVAGCVVFVVGSKVVISCCNKTSYSSLANYFWQLYHVFWSLGQWHCHWPKLLYNGLPIR